MTTVSPPPPPPPPSGGSNPANTATLVTPSAEIANLARGTNIEGVVLATLGKNQLQVQTVYGTIVLQTAVKIPLNSIITLTLSQLQPQPILQVSGINGVPLPNSSAFQSANPVSTQAQASNPNASPTPSGQAPTLSVGVSTSATLVRPATAIIQPASTNAGATGATPSASSVPATTNAATQQASNISTQGQGSGQSQTQSTGLPGKAAPTNTPGQPVAGQTSPQGQAGTLKAPIPSAPGASGLIKPDALSATPRGTPNPGASGQGASQQVPGGNTGGVSVPSGSKFSANVIKIEAPTGGSLTPSAGPSGAVLTLARGTIMSGVVTGTTQSGQPIIQLPSATIALDVK
ncbi:MAG: hypothetical protein OEX17_04245, partial [Rhodospirillaceae bacterium]|nr:hypothetical protein [Rhodospirillaceae bacterium]